MPIFRKNTPEHREFLQLCEEKKWSSYPRINADADLTSFLEKHDYSWRQASKKYYEWMKEKNSNTNNNTGTNNNQQQKNKKRKKSKKKKKIKKGVFNQPAALRSIEDAIEDLKTKEAAKDAGEIILPLILNEKQKWITLQASLIAKLKSIIENQSDTKKGYIIAANKFVDAKHDIIEKFALQWNDIQVDGVLEYGVCAKAYILGTEFCRSLLFSLTEQGSEININNNINNLLKTNNIEQAIIPNDNMYKERIYYISGWLLYASQQRAKKSRKNGVLYRYLPELVSGSITKNCEERKHLPINMVATVETREGCMKYPNKVFYIFVCILEKICSEILVSSNLCVLGGSIIQQLFYHLSENNNIMHDYFKPCIHKDVVDTICNDDLSSLHRYVINTFMRMRGKDFMRSFMGKYRGGPQVGHRQTIAVVSNKNNYKKQKTDNNKEAATTNNNKNDGAANTTSNNNGTSAHGDDNDNEHTTGATSNNNGTTERNDDNNNECTTNITTNNNGTSAHGNNNERTTGATSNNHGTSARGDDNNNERTNGATSNSNGTTAHGDDNNNERTTGATSNNNGTTARGDDNNNERTTNITINNNGTPVGGDDDSYDSLDCLLQNDNKKLNNDDEEDDDSYDSLDSLLTNDNKKLNDTMDGTVEQIVCDDNSNNTNYKLSDIESDTDSLIDSDSDIE